MPANPKPAEDVLSMDRIDDVRFVIAPPMTADFRFRFNSGA